MAELLLHPPLGILSGPVSRPRAPSLKVIGQIQKIGYRQLHRLQIPDIDDPYIPDAIIERHGHLLPDLLQRNGVHPFIGKRTAVIVKMVIHPPACAAALPAGRRDFAEVAKVVVRQQNDNII
ncbi:hypothetical protein D3C73_736180 [compost metagenome]